MQSGEAVGRYRIVSPLGAGGMGEVWRAQDSTLGREVALKVLPADVADDPDRLLRLEREAKMLASLNHPNIATLYGLETAALCHPEGAQRVEGSPESGETIRSQRAPETSGGPSTPAPSDVASAQDDIRSFTFLVMELVDGEDLSERISRGPIPIGEAIPIALQIAEALEAAHEQGIVHRDLKPANIKLKPDGTVKVLDFGLAKAWEADVGDHSLSLSPTMTRNATAAGIILGTAGYMAPEQAAGLGADRRADIWSFGVVLWEMLTGARLFDGETVSHVLASVLKDEPDLAALPEGTPPRIGELVGRCLRKKPRARVQAIGDVRITLEEYLADPDGVRAPAVSLSAPRPAVWRRVMPWAVATAIGVAATAAWLLVPAAPTRVVKATVPPPVEMRFDLRPAAPGPAAVSPDGSKIAFTASDDKGRSRIFVRNLDAGEAYVLSGTEGAQYPFWAPDSRWLGFFTQPDDLLRKIDTAGGPPITLCDAPNGKGGAWSPDGVIVFAPDAGSNLLRVPSAGGEPVEATAMDPDRHNSHRLPWFLPDGRHFLFVARGVAAEESAIMIGSLDGDETRELMRNQSQAAYASGRLLFVRDQTLMAQPFDPDDQATSAEAVPVAENVLVIPGASLAVFGVSRNGVLTFQTGNSEINTTLEWRDREGDPNGVLGDAGLYRVVALSPDGANVATQVVEMEGGTFDLWIYEVERNIRTRFTFDPASDVAPVWSPDGNDVYFASDRDNGFGVYRKPLSGVGEVELVYSGEGSSFPASVSPDGRLLCVSSNGKSTGSDILLVPLIGGDQPTIFRQTEFNEGGARISPDGRWVAYHCDESGDFEVYVTTFPVAGRRWQISSGNGVYPEWRADGGEIVFSDFNGELIAVQVDGGGDTFHVGAAEPLFSIRPPEAGGSFYSVSGDGQRFLVIPNISQQADTLLNLVVNWPVQMEARR